MRSKIRVFELFWLGYLVINFHAFASFVRLGKDFRH